MAVTLQQFGLDQLAPQDRLELIELLWDSLPEEVSPEEVPAWHMEVFSQRLAEAEANPNAGKPWREALERFDNSPGDTRRG